MAKAHIPKNMRARVAEAARYRYGYRLAQEAVVGSPLEIDHSIPESPGGPTGAENPWLACSLCSAHKGERIAASAPQTGALVRLFDARREDWSVHLTWVSANTRILGLTSTGRATVAVLRMNRPALVRARQAWSQAGWHPPRD